MERIELALDTPTEAGETAIRLWSNLPEEIGAGRVEPRGSPEIAGLYRKRWRIEGMFGRLESVLHGEIRSHRRFAGLIQNLVPIPF